MTRRVLLTGGSGQVGQALQALAWPPDVALAAPGRDALQLSDGASIAAYLRASPDLAAILSVGAYTAVDRAESEADLAEAVNVRAPGILAAHAAQSGIPIIHVSTDYVFDGSGTRPWRENDPVSPLGVYGATKAAGEAAVRASGARHVILRTSWVVGAKGQNFVRTMLRLGAERTELKVVDDQIGSPTHAGDLAGSIRTILLRLLDDDRAPTGTFHIANAGETSWHGVAARVFAAAAGRGGPSPTLTAIPSSGYPTPARRPLNSRLDASALTEAFAIRLRRWEEAIDDIVAEIMEPARRI
jgi:dTDP-4-dehydrorhamnose reductase